MGAKLLVANQEGGLPSRSWPGCPPPPLLGLASAWQPPLLPSLRSGERRLVAHLLLVANQDGRRRRSLRAVTPYYTRWANRQRELVLSEKPGVLRHLGSLHKKVLKQYQTLQKRERTPLEEAQFYARQMEARGLKSLAGLARVLRVPPKRVTRHVLLLGLPAPIKRFLAEHRTPEYIRYFSEGRLRTLLRLDGRSAWTRFQAMVEEAKKEAGIWKTSGQ